MKISSSDKDGTGQFRIYFTEEELTELGTDCVRIYGSISTNISVTPHLGAMPVAKALTNRIKDKTGGAYFLRRVTKMAGGVGRIQISPNTLIGLKPGRRFRAYNAIVARSGRVIDVGGERVSTTCYQMTSPSIHISKQPQAKSRNRHNYSKTAHSDGSVGYKSIPKKDDLIAPPDRRVKVERKYKKKRAGGRSLNSLINAVERINVLIKKTPPDRLNGISIGSEHNGDGSMKIVRVYQDVVRQVHLN